MSAVFGVTGQSNPPTLGIFLISLCESGRRCYLTVFILAAMAVTGGVQREQFVFSQPRCLFENRLNEIGSGILTAG